MSFLSILFFASAFYVAYTKPQWSTAIAEAAGNVGPAVPQLLQVPSVPIMDVLTYQQPLSGFMQVLSKAIDHYMTPTAQLDTQTQDELKTVGMNGFASYVNYLRHLIKEKENEDAKGDDDEDYGGFRLNEDDIIEIESLGLFDAGSPLLTEVHARV